MTLDDASVPPSPPSLRHKLKHSLSFSCCFGRRNNRSHQPLRSPPTDDNPALIWIETKTRQPCDQSLSEVKDKCISIFAATGGKHRRHASAEFSYDPMSYAMNFEDGSEFDDEAPLKSFSARLPPSPPLPAAVSR